MQLTKVRVFQFRNFQQEEILLSPAVNLFRGSNAQGKTNLLEAIYLLAYGKSFRTTQPKDCVLYGATEARVEGTVSSGGLERRLAVEISPRGKRLMIHAKEAPMEEFIGNLHALAFTSEHLEIVRGGPAQRRAFLDRAMVTIYPAHVRRLATYNRALKQRNRLLTEAREKGVRPDERLLESWEATLIRDGARIASDRLRYTARMKELLPAGVFGSEILKIHYISAARTESSSAEETEMQLRNKIRQARDADLRNGHTSIGPHRDDLKLFVDTKPLAEFGSAGQQRSALLSLYFAQMEIHRESHGFYPLLLVDDAEAELDDRRLASFLAYVSPRTQTVLTTAKSSLLPSMPSEVRTFEVINGSVRTQ